MGRIAGQVFVAWPDIMTGYPSGILQPADFRRRTQLARPLHVIKVEVMAVSD